MLLKLRFIRIQNSRNALELPSDVMKFLLARAEGGTEESFQAEPIEYKDVSPARRLARNPAGVRHVVGASGLREGMSCTHVGTFA